MQIKQVILKASRSPSCGTLSRHDQKRMLKYTSLLIVFGVYWSSLVSSCAEGF